MYIFVNIYIYWFTFLLLLNCNVLISLVSGSGPNGAIIHFKPEPESCSVVDANKLFLLDSGAQYVDGTTDITRSVHFGKPTAREKECITRVLQVSCSCAFFPEINF